MDCKVIFLPTKLFLLHPKNTLHSNQKLIQPRPLERCNSLYIFYSYIKTPTPLVSA